MSIYQWNSTAEGPGPIPAVFIANVSTIPIGDQGMLRLMIVNHPLHGAAFDAIEEHGINREVGLILDGKIYYYMAVMCDDDEWIYLVPADDKNETLPDNVRLTQKRVTLKLRW